jgi:hypothetical protein
MTKVQQKLSTVGVWSIPINLISLAFIKNQAQYGIIRDSDAFVTEHRRFSLF